MDDSLSDSIDKLNIPQRGGLAGVDPGCVRAGSGVYPEISCHSHVFHVIVLLWPCRWTEGHRGGADNRPGVGGLVYPLAPGIGHLGFAGHLDGRS